MALKEAKIVAKYEGETSYTLMDGFHYSDNEVI